ncbi:hypothetical protein [Roseateles sp.]|uniref:hypothetical protein n=1 Tax=Roseateles sp. TaxID=1971397 RepID=UPI0031E2E48D
MSSDKVLGTGEAGVGEAAIEGVGAAVVAAALAALATADAKGDATGVVVVGPGAAALASFSALEKSAAPDLAPLAGPEGAGAPARTVGDGEAEDLTCMAKRSRSLG